MLRNTWCIVSLIILIFFSPTGFFVINWNGWQCKVSKHLEFQSLTSGPMHRVKVFPKRSSFSQLRPFGAYLTTSAQLLRVKVTKNRQHYLRRKVSNIDSMPGFFCFWKNENIFNIGLKNIVLIRKQSQMSITDFVAETNLCQLLHFKTMITLHVPFEIMWRFPNCLFPNNERCKSPLKLNWCRDVQTLSDWISVTVFEISGLKHTQLVQVCNLMEHCYAWSPSVVSRE